MFALGSEAHAPVVDATAVTVVVHQNHPFRWRLAPKFFEKLEKSIDADHPFVTKGLFDLEVEVMGQRRDPTPELLVRYEINIERQISLTIDQLERWRMMRPNRPKLPAELEEQIESQEENNTVGGT